MNINLDNAIDKNRWLREGARFRASVFTKCRLGIQGDTGDWWARRQFARNAIATISSCRASGNFVTERYGAKSWLPHAQDLAKILGETVYVVFANHIHLGAFSCNEQTAGAAFSCLLTIDGDSIFFANLECTEFVAIDYDADWPVASRQFELSYLGERTDLAKKFM